MKTIKMLINKYEEIIAYLIVGAMTTGLSIVSYYFCTRFIALNYQISNVLSWIISVSFAFVANKKFVFKYVSKDRKSLFLEIFNFFKYRILSLLIDMFLMFLLFDQLKFNDLLSKVIVQIIIIIINYIFSKFLVFKKEKRDTFTYQNNNIEITESNISGIINPQLVLKGDVKRKNVILKICTLKKEIFRTKIKEKFFNISVLLSKNDKTIRLIEESENNEILIDTLKNTLLRRVLYKVYAQIKIFKENFNYKRKMLFNRLFRKDSYNLLSNEYDRIFHGGVADRKDYYYLFLPDDYLEWFSKEMEQQKYDKLDYNPLISILIPVYNTDEVLLKECLNSILIQKYQNFEVCIVDDCSTNLNVKKILKEYSRKDKRIKVKYRDTNGHISIATNDALDMATGDYIALMDSDDTICENTLYEVAFAINKNRNIDMIYTDEDKINSEGLLQDPYFKPDYSPENLMFGNYICHFSVFRGSILKSLGGFKPEFVGAQDFDIVLRFVEKINPDNIYHINKVLYHWRKAPGSTAENIANKSYAIENGKKVLESALQRRGLCGKVKLPKVMAHYLIEYTYKNEPMLSIIVSCSQITSNLTKCLNSIYETNKYKNFEVILITNKKNNKLKKYEHEYKNLKVVSMGKKNNINDVIFNSTNGEYLLFLDSNIKIDCKNTLNDMVGYAMQEHIGAVGIKILYQDDTVKSAGLIIGKGDTHYKYSNFDSDSMGSYGRLAFPINCSAVSLECLMINKHKLEEIGGFDENFKISYIDADICLRLLEKKYYNVALLNEYVYYTLNRRQEFLLIGKKHKLLLKDLKYFQSKVGFNYTDPFYNSNCSLKETDYVER